MRFVPFALISALLATSLLGHVALAAPVSPQLARIDALDLELYHKPVVEGQTVPLEIPQAIKQTLLNNPVLPYQSPADAVMLLSCAGLHCSSIDAKIVLRSLGGIQGPVIWHHREVTGYQAFMPWFTVDSEPNMADVGTRLAKNLLKDYQRVQTQKVSGKRIEPQN